MSIEQEDTIIEIPSQSNNNVIINEPSQATFKKKFTFRDFIQMSGLTLIFLLLSIIIMVIGVALFYRISEETIQNVGFWMILIGVVAFMFTLIVGFEKID